jgi:hypothetical protein
MGARVNYDYFMQNDDRDNQIEILQRQQPNQERRQPENQVDQPSGPPGRRPSNVPVGPPPNAPVGPPPNVPMGPPPNVPGGQPSRESQQRAPEAEFYPRDRDRDNDRDRDRDRDRDNEYNPRQFRRCLNRYMYVWLRNGNSFWFYPIYIAGDTLIGYRWREFGWVYFTLNIRRISYYQCY